jgi:hypothetical protein
VNAQLDASLLTGVGSEYDYHSQGGFETSGRIVYGEFAIMCANSTLSTPENNFVFTVENILEDAWSLNKPTGSGSLTVALDSTVISTSAVDGTSGFLLETGPVTDQSFVGGSAIDTTKQLLYIGGGDYSTLFDETAKTTLTLSPEADGTIAFESMGFGFVTYNTENITDPASGYYQKLGYPHQPQAALIAPNFAGLGVPEYLWLQLTNLLYKVDSLFDKELTCIQEQGGMCHLASPCSTYTKVWGKGWGFQARFNSANL